MDEKLKEKVKDVVADIFSVSIEEVKDEATLVSLGMDSLDHLELVVELEEAFEIEIDDPSAALLETVTDVLQCVEEKLAMKRGNR